MNQTNEYTKEEWEALFGDMVNTKREGAEATPSAEPKVNEAQHVEPKPVSSTPNESAVGETPKSGKGKLSITLPPKLKKIIPLIGVVAACLLLIVVGLKFGLGKKHTSGGTDEPVPTLPTMDDLDWMFETTPVPEFKYTAAEIIELRQNGYTGDEIEENEFLKVSADSLIAKAKAERQALYESEIAPYMDATSDEFKELQANTWLGLESFTVDKRTEKVQKFVKTVNADYEKLEPHGNQLLLKITLESGMILFMNISTEQYVRLNNSGNIVLTISYEIMGNGRAVVTEIKEVRI